MEVNTQFILIAETNFLLLSISKTTKDNPKVMEYINKQSSQGLLY